MKDNFFDAIMWVLAIWLSIVLVASLTLKAEVFSRANEFATAYNIWAQLKQQEKPGTASAPAMRQWNEVRKQFKLLDEEVKSCR